ncbi:16073_t:CDS:2 [Dentiscutata erythropus]|uniref:16073_t:CDS:1 n=1 Tax=Dentiscutata erythropus TaxID=1348616 RepID=A0A9N9JIJ3_9GLOM|nr:16073_t:CDS:2 [Dentiscutata erythropus]
MSLNNNALSFVFVDPSHQISRQRPLELTDKTSSSEAVISSLCQLEAEIPSLCQLVSQLTDKMSSLETKISQLTFLAFLPEL